MMQCVEFGTRPSGLRGATKLDEGQVLALAEMIHDEIEPVAAGGPSSWHSRPRFESVPRCWPSIERVLGCPPEQVNMRSWPRLPSVPACIPVTSEKMTFPAGGMSKSSTQGHSSPQCRSARGLDPGTWV